MLKKILKRFYGEDSKNLSNLCRIINKHHFDRLCSLLKEPGVKDSIVYGGLSDEAKL